MRTREQARKNWTKAAARAKKFARYVVPTKTAEYNAMVRFYQSCPEGFEVDHIVQLAEGGEHKLDNLRYLEKSENRSRGGRLSPR